MNNKEAIKTLLLNNEFYRIDINNILSIYKIEDERIVVEYPDRIIDSFYNYFEYNTLYFDELDKAIDSFFDIKNNYGKNLYRDR